MDDSTMNLKNFSCADRAKKDGFPLLGTFSGRDKHLLLEVEEPWAKNILLSPFFRDEERTHLASALKMVPGLAMNGVLPQKESIQNQAVRVMLWEKTEGWEYQKREWILPRKELGGFLPQIFTSSPQTHRVENAFQDIVVCGHQERDRCCGKLGKPLYEFLASHPELQKANKRIWCSSHLGGHKWAPTFVDLAVMRCWGQVTDFEKALQIILKKGETSSVTQCYRGFGGLKKTWEQVAEKELLEKFGWDWLEQKQWGVNSQEVELGKYKVDFACKGEHFIYHPQLQDTVQTLGSCGDEELSGYKYYMV